MHLADDAKRCCTVPRSPAGSIEFGSSSSMRKQELDAARDTCC
jgi:hypothetical protein